MTIAYVKIWSAVEEGVKHEATQSASDPCRRCCRWMIYYFSFYLSGLSNSEIKASGHIEVTEVDMSFRIAGHVQALVDEA